MIYFFIKNMVATHWILLELLQAVKQEYSFFSFLPVKHSCVSSRFFIWFEIWAAAQGQMETFLKCS